jgi:hypothetical protein
MALKEIEIPSYQDIRQTPGGYAFGLYQFTKATAEKLNEVIMELNKQGEGAEKASTTKKK